MKRKAFDELIADTSYGLAEVKLEGFEGKQFGCKVYETHIPKWFLTDYDHRYHNLPDLYKSPNLLEKTGHFALFKEGQNLESAKHVSAKILRYREHAMEYINAAIQ